MTFKIIGLQPILNLEYFWKAHDHRTKILRIRSWHRYDRWIVIWGRNIGVCECTWSWDAKGEFRGFIKGFAYVCVHRGVCGGRLPPTGHLCFAYVLLLKLIKLIDMTGKPRCCAAESVIEGGVGGGFPQQAISALPVLCLRLCTKTN